MRRVLTWHTRAGEVGLLLLKLHLLWVVWSLAGGIVLGVFPATAAVYGVVRGELLGSPREFRRLWRQEFRTANAVGYVFAAAWAVLLLDRWLLETADLGVVEPLLGALLWLTTLFVSCMTVNIWILAAHFAEGPLALVRRSAILVLARPLQALVALLVVGVILCGYYLVPGLVPVFGVAVPAFASFAYVWGTAVLPRGPGSFHDTSLGTS
ncbi:YesL family protein [Nonomuraea sp. NPDC050153]|uniref:YesL family protein n=1 Tax=Nonomuraea sp. NPDC050153 TaxID=3364359 RepID=UPI0037A66B24